MNQHVLLIDDDEAFKRLLELRLKSFMRELKVTSFGSLKDARNFLQNSEQLNFDLVILDEHLPDGRGVELLQEGHFQDIAVLTISSDDAPEIPGASVQAGSMYFLSKFQVSEPLFRPLIEGVLDRNKIQRELQAEKLKAVQMNTVQTLVSTLRHEINNPLGAVFGAAYLLKTAESASDKQRETAHLVEESAERIKHVLDKLCKAVSLETVKKANQATFHIEGDEPWIEGSYSDEDEE